MHTSAVDRKVYKILTERPAKSYTDLIAILTRAKNCLSDAYPVSIRTNRLRDIIGYLGQVKKQKVELGTIISRIRWIDPAGYDDYAYHKSCTETIAYALMTLIVTWLEDNDRILK